MMVTVKPTLPANARACASLSFAAGVAGFEYDSMADSSSMFHVLPMLKLPLLFSRALCIRTRPVDRTAMMIRRGFLFDSKLSAGGGADGYCASSMIRIWVM